MRRHHHALVNRRGLLQTGIAALASGQLLSAASEPEAITLQPAEKVQTQTFPWGWIQWVMNGQIDPQAEMTLGIVQVEAHQTNPLHVHPNSAEYLHMLSGTCEHLMGDRWVTLKAGDTLRIPKGVPHQARTRDRAFRAVIVYDTPARQMVVK